MRYHKKKKKRMIIHLHLTLKKLINACNNIISGKLQNIYRSIRRRVHYGIIDRKHFENVLWIAFFNFYHFNFYISVKTAPDFLNMSVFDKDVVTIAMLRIFLFNGIEMIFLRFLFFIIAIRRTVTMIVFYKIFLKE